MKLKSPYLVHPHSRVRLAEIAAESPDGFKDEISAKVQLAHHRDQIEKLQERFYAAQSTAMLIVLQGMDTAGKDGTIRHIFTGVNPQGCDVTSFKVPTPLEARHDFLWRCHQHVPARGMIGIFNRSHYEDVLYPVVHGQIDKKTLRQRLDNINAFEDMLADSGVMVLKFFLHISRSEQTERLQARIDDPDKRWKLSPADFAERRFWPQYIDAYEDVLRHTSRKHAPWFVIPSDHKWYRNVAISTVLVDVFQSLKLEYPQPTFDPRGLKLSKQTPKTVARKVIQRAKKGVGGGDTDSAKGVAVKP